jgi:hypothetical protein
VKKPILRTAKIGQAIKKRKPLASQYVACNDRRDYFAFFNPPGQPLAPLIFPQPVQTSNASGARPASIR